MLDSSYRKFFSLLLQSCSQTFRLQSAMDYVGYATGQTDKFQGTGVFNGIKMEREPEKKEEESKPAEEKKE